MNAAHSLSLLRAVLAPMIINIKALIVVLAIAAVVFRLGKPIALLFSSEPDFARRRNVWFVLTATAFLSPNFWLFVLVAAPLLAWAGRKDTNPVALYLILLHVIPPIPVEIPVVGIRAVICARQLSTAVVLRVDSRGVAAEKVEELKSDSRANRHGFFNFGFRIAATFPLCSAGFTGSHNLAGLCHERLAARLSLFR